MVTLKAYFRGLPVSQRSLKTLSMSTVATNDDNRDILNQQRMSHNDFFWHRDWKLVSNFWSDVVRNSSIPSPFITGDSMFGVTDLQPLNHAGLRGEFTSSDYRYSTKRTFALRIGYVGTTYNGYQRQTNAVGVHTVEDDLMISLGCRTYGAGRTDAGVSAVSQVVSMQGKINDTAEMLLEKMRASEPVLAGRLSVYDCVRVPKKFNARSSATWRRYLYLLPLNKGDYPGGYDIDIDFVNDALNRLENIELAYNGFAYHEDRTQGEGLKDICTLYRARASKIVINSNRPANSSETLVSSLDSSSQVANDVISLSSEGAPIYVSTPDAICVELVGSRFLRKMVRILVATVARESTLPIDTRNVNILVDICNSGKRHLAAAAVPGNALCFAGVGYDPLDLAILKFISKKNLAAILAENEEMFKSGSFFRVPSSTATETTSETEE